MRLGFQSEIWKKRWVQHLLFWISIVLFFTFLYGSFSDDYWRQFQAQLLFLPNKIIAVYLTIYWLAPRFLFTQRYVHFGLLLMMVLFLAGIGHWWVGFYVERELWYNSESWGRFWNYAKIIKSSTYIFPYVLAAFSIKFLKYWFREQKKNQEIIQGQLETELKFLKSQLNPHFLFNTLNNLYALTLKKSDTAPELVLKLSSLLDYMLYECDVKRIPLKKEVKFLEDYVEIEKLRFGERLTVNVNIKGKQEGWTIAPLIFLPFLENAFKHGASTNLDEANLDILLQLEDSTLTFAVINTTVNTSGPMEGNNGIGLQNVKRRLELLYGKEQYELTIDDNEAYYKVTLQLKNV